MVSVQLNIWTLLGHLLTLTQNFKKNSSDLKNSKTRTCFRPFWATLLMFWPRTPPSPSPLKMRKHQIWLDVNWDPKFFFPIFVFQIFFCNFFSSINENLIIWTKIHCRILLPYLWPLTNPDHHPSPTVTITKNDKTPDLAWSKLGLEFFFQIFAQRFVQKVIQIQNNLNWSALQ